MKRLIIALAIIATFGSCKTLEVTKQPTGANYLKIRAEAHVDGKVRYSDEWYVNDSSYTDELKILLKHLKLK